MSGWWDVEEGDVEAGPRGDRVRVRVDGTEVVVDAPEGTLAPSAEAWPTAFAVPAAHAGVGLRVGHAVDPRWHAGCDANLAAMAGWWGCDDHLDLEAAAPPTVGGLLPSGPGTGQCFTAGVDAFYTLLHFAVRPTHLVWVAGFDLDERDRRRVDATAATVQAVADELGLVALVVSTDLRRHPGFDAVSWGRTHGAALAAIGHLLRPVLGTLVIPPSYRVDRSDVWGTSPRLDPRWGVPGSTTIVHGDASLGRIDRVRAIADEPLVHRHLRVCHDPGESVNCGACEKCVRTMAMLETFGALDRTTTFPDASALPAAISRLGALRPSKLHLWVDIAADPACPCPTEVASLLAATRADEAKLDRRRRRRAAARRLAGPQLTDALRAGRRLLRR